MLALKKSFFFCSLFTCFFRICVFFRSCPAEIDKSWRIRAKCKPNVEFRVGSLIRSFRLVCRDCRLSSSEFAPALFGAFFAHYFVLHVAGSFSTWFLNGFVFLLYCFGLSSFFFLLLCPQMFMFMHIFLFAFIGLFLYLNLVHPNNEGLTYYGRQKFFCLNKIKTLEK